VCRCTFPPLGVFKISTSNSKETVAKFYLSKPVFRIGEDVVGWLDFSSSTVSCFQVRSFWTLDSMRPQSLVCLGVRLASEHLYSFAVCCGVYLNSVPNRLAREIFLVLTNAQPVTTPTGFNHVRD